MPAAALPLSSTDLTRPLEDGEALPRCQVERTPEEFILYVGNKEMQRFTHTSGRNFIADPTNRYGEVLLLVTKSLQGLRDTKICQ